MDIGRQANNYKLDGQWDDAYREYGRALQLLKDSKQEPQSLDMQLNMAQMLINSRRLKMASDLLAEIRSTLNKHRFPHDLLELRYWRRVCDLEQARGRHDETIQAFKRVLELNMRHFGASSILYMDELRGILSLYSHSRRYDEVISVARELEKKSKDLPPATSKGPYLEAAANARMFVLSEINRFITERRLTEARSLLEQYGGEMPAKPLMDNWFWLAGPARQAGDEKTEMLAFRNVMRIFETALTNPTREDWITYEQACMGIGYKKVNMAIGEQDRELVSLTRKGANALEHAYTPAERRRLLRYVQTKSMEAFALAKAGRLAEAETAIDQVDPDPSFFTRTEQLFGIYQARAFGLADGYLDKGDINRFEDQYNRLKTLLDKMTKIPDRYEHWQQWEDRKHRRLARHERLEKRRLQQQRLQQQQ